MRGTVLFHLVFDPTNGPVISQTLGEDPFDEDQHLSLMACSFPDTVIQQNTDSIIFSFKIGNYFCFAMYTSKPDPLAPRGHNQDTLIIASKHPNIYPFTRLLHSSMVLVDMKPSEIILFLENFLLKWYSSYPSKNGDTVELPMFDGTLPVSITDDHNELLSMTAGYGWIPQCKLYYLNDNFLGMDIVENCSLASLFSHGRSLDILKLWESAILDESILIYGATPTIASKCAFVIGSFLFPELPYDYILPFLSVSDIRFQNLLKCKAMHKQIVGVSNPIAINASSKFDKVFTVGFPNEENGLNIPKQQWKGLKEVNSETSNRIRKFLYHNTLKIIDGITSCLNRVRESDPYAEYLGQIPQELLEKCIAASTPILTQPYGVFAKKLLRSTFLARIWKRRCTEGTLKRELEGYRAEERCKGKTEHELVDIYSGIMEVRKNISDVGPASALVDRDINIVKQYLSQDLILST